MSNDRLTNVDLEKALIGALLNKPRYYDEVSSLVKASDFYNSVYSLVYAKITEQIETTGDCDIHLLLLRLGEECLREIGGQSVLAELMTYDRTGSRNVVIKYATEIHNLSIRRRLLASSREVEECAYDVEASLNESIASAENSVLSVMESTTLSDVESISSTLTEVYHLLDDADEGNAIRGLSTGFYELDNIIGGLRDSELIIVAARPGMGKTAFALNVADFLSVEQGKSVLFFSLEMSKKELTFRALCGRAGVSNEVAIRPSTSEEKARLIQAGKELEHSKLLLTDQSYITASEISTLARQTKRKQGLDLILIDYVGLVTPDDKRVVNRQEQVASIARRFKTLAKELEIPVIVMAQLNRNLESEKDHRPKLSHLRESGALEQDADVVLLIHREEYYVSKEEAEEKGLVGKAEIIVAKHRAGRTGSAFLNWKGDSCQFLNYERIEDFTAFEEGSGAETYKPFEDFDFEG